MDHLTDYVKWMGNVPFDGGPGDVDAMVLCYLSYADLSPALGAGEEMTLREAVERTEEKGGISCMIVTDDPLFPERVRLIASGRRFGDLTVSGYTDEHDGDSGLQFCAMVFRAPAWSFIAFRGTDQTLAGWKEDFMMSFTAMPSQIRAAEYAGERIGGGAWYIGGHSKGGNLALYAASVLDAERQERLEKVYLLDSPGLCREALEGTDIRMDGVRDRIVRIIPEYDVVGSLFAPDTAREIIVRSDASGLMQHDMATWGVDHGALLTAEKRDPMSVLLDDAMGEWLRQLDRPSREKFVSGLFGQLEKGGRKTLKDVSAEGILGYESIVIGMIRRQGGRDLLERFPLRAAWTRLLGRAGAAVARLGRLKNGIVQCAALIGLGAVVILVSERFLETAAAVFLCAMAVAQDVWTVRRIVRSGGNPRGHGPHIVLSLMATALTVCMLFKENAAFLLGSVGVSVALLIMAIHCFRLFYLKKKKGFYRIIRLPESLILTVFGVIYLLVPQAGAGDYSAALGMIAAADGVIRLGYIILSAVFHR